MNNELTKLIREEIDIRNESIRDVSNKLRELQKFYNLLVSRKNKNKKHNALDVIGKGTVELFLEFTDIIEKYNKVLYNELEALMDESLENDKKIFDISTPKTGYNYSGFIEADEEEFKKIQESEKRIEEKTIEFFDYVGTYLVELYEKLYEEKERKKDARKIYDSALKTLTRNRTLSSKEIKAITELIESKDINKNKYYELLNEYIKRKNDEVLKKKQEETAISKNEEKVEQDVYIDSESLIPQVAKKEEPINTLISNYVTSIYALKSDKISLKEFLDAISYNEDFEEILNKIIIIISENGDTILSEFLKDYQKELSKEEDIIEDDTEEIILLYYGFLQEKETILKDIDDIHSREDYKDILRALEMIKTDGAKDNRKNIVRIRKVFKLRVNNIRVTFKRISKNVYIVLGVYRKKDNHGAEIIFSAERRNNHLLRDEKQISNAIKIPELWKSYLEKNSEIEDNIINLLKQHIYSV